MLTAIFFFLIEENKSVIKVKILQNSGVTVHAEKGLAPTGVIDFNGSAHEDTVLTPEQVCDK